MFDSDVVSLWDDAPASKVHLKNLTTGQVFSFYLKGPVTVGRKKEMCDIQVSEDDAYMSRRHLRFSRNNNIVYIEDLSGSGATKLNGHTLSSSKTVIHSGDRLRLGRTEFIVNY